MQFTAAQCKKIKILHHSHSFRQIALLLKRDEEAVKRKALAMGLRKNPVVVQPAPKAWSAEDIATLRRMYKSHHVHEIADALGRSFYSTERKARDLRLYKKPRLWLPKEDQVIRAKYAEGWSTGQIGSLLSRPSRSVSKRLARLGIRRPKIVHPIGQERIDRDGIAWRKVSNTVGADLANWRRVDHIQWEEANGPIPDEYTLMVINKYLPRTPSNMRLMRKDELWEVATGNWLPPELRELAVLKRQIEREAQKQKKK